jgi:hypothetical protein
MKKKYKLKKGVKNTLITILGIGVLVIVLIGMNNQYDNAVKDCVAGGNSQDYCEAKLK